VFEEALPRVDADSRRSVVIVRLRGHVDLGTTFIDVLARYAASLAETGSRLVVVSVDSRVMNQLEAGGVMDIIGPDGAVVGDKRVGAAVAKAVAAAQEWIDADRGEPGSPTVP
jgi:SulP family sulfate permease